MTNFRVQVNPFKKQAIIKTNIDSNDYSLTVNYDEIESTKSFELGGQKFDIKFSYDYDFFSVSIHAVVNGHIDFKKNIMIDFRIKLADYCYQDAKETPFAIKQDMPVPVQVIVLSNLFKIGASLSRMAESYYGDKKLRIKMQREIIKLSIKYPTLFSKKTKNR